MEENNLFQNKTENLLNNIILLINKTENNNKIEINLNIFEDYIQIIKQNNNNKINLLNFIQYLKDNDDKEKEKEKKENLNSSTTTFPSSFPSTSTSAPLNPSVSSPQKTSFNFSTNNSPFNSNSKKIFTFPVQKKTNVDNNSTNSNSQFIFESPKQSNKNNNDNKMSETKTTTPFSVDSISSSINSSWSASSFQSPSVKFNFQTPQKIFHFDPVPTPKKEDEEIKENNTKDEVKKEVKEENKEEINKEKEKENNEKETNPPQINNNSNKNISKSLFFDDVDKNESETKKLSEESKPSIFKPNSTLFSFGSAPSNVQKSGSKGVKKVTKKSLLFKTTTQKTNESTQSTFLFSDNVHFTQTENNNNNQNINNNSENKPDEDEDMEIGQNEDNNPSESTQFQPKIWNIPKTTDSTQSNNIPNLNETQSQSQPQFPFQFQSTSQTQQNIPQLNKKKINSAIKKKSKLTKKGTTDKEGLSKLDDQLNNMKLNTNFDDNSGTKSPKKEPPFGEFNFNNNSNNQNHDSSNSNRNNNNHNDKTNHNNSEKKNLFGSESNSEFTNKMYNNNSVDNRKAQMADIHKREGKEMYSLQRYDLAYHAFTKCLNTAPLNWSDRPNILSNRAASLIMMERLVEAIRDCEEAAKIDPQFVKIHTRRGRALLKLGQISEASEAFCYVLSWQPSSNNNNIEVNNSEEADKYGKELAKQAMKQVVFAKTLRDRLLNGTCTTNKQLLQTAEELLSLCPYMRLAQTYKAQALCQLKKWSEAKSYMELCVCSIHETMQLFYAHPNADLTLLDIQCLNWIEAGYSVIQVDIDTVVSAILTMGPEMAKYYIMSLKNQDICRTSCSAESMLKLSEILTLCKQLVFGRVIDLTDDLVNNSWYWLYDADIKIKTMITLKTGADEKFRNNLFMEAINCYTEVLQVDEDAYLWNAIMFGNRAASSMRLGLFNEAVSDCYQSLARDEFYSRAYLRRARAYRALGNHSGSIKDYRKYLKSEPKPNDYEAIEEELLEALRSKNEEERFERTAPGYTNFTNRTSSSSSSSSSSSTNRTNNTNNTNSNTNNNTNGNKFERTNHRSFEWSSKGDTENNHSPNREKRRSSVNSKIPQADNNSTRSNQSTKQNTVEADVHSTNFYLRLGVDSKATEQEIKTAYRKLALKYHPDKNSSENASDIFKSITEAYTQLSEKTTRRTYDDTLLYSRASRGYNGNRR